MLVGVLWRKVPSGHAAPRKVQNITKCYIISFSFHFHLESIFFRIAEMKCVCALFCGVNNPYQFLVWIIIDWWVCILKKYWTKINNQTKEITEFVIFGNKKLNYKNNLNIIFKANSKFKIFITTHNLYVGIIKLSY